MKIHNKLFLILFSFTFSVIAGLVVLIQWSIGQGVIDFVNAKEVKALEPLVAQLSKQYEQTPSWKRVVGGDENFRKLVESQLENSQFLPRLPESPGPRGRMMRRPPPDHIGFGMGSRPPPENIAHYALLDENKQRIMGRYLSDLNYIKTAIIVDDKTVGYLAVSKRDSLVDGYELDFLQQQTNYLWFIALAAVLLTLKLPFYCLAT